MATLLGFPPLSFRLDKWSQYLFTVLLLLLILLVMLSPSVVAGYAGIGGFISEKLLSRTGTGDSSLYLSRDGGGPIVLGVGPTISTGGTTSTELVGGTTTATLHGTVSSLNGFPRAEIWFMWGYGAGDMTNSSVVDTVTATGDYSITITGYDPGQDVSYEFRSATDGTAVGNTESFRIEGGQGASYWILWNLLPMVIAIGTFVVVIRLTGNFVAALIAVATALITIVLIRSIMPILW